MKASGTVIDAEKRGAIGCCFGGEWSLDLALANPPYDERAAADAWTKMSAFFAEHLGRRA